MFPQEVYKKLWWREGRHFICGTSVAADLLLGSVTLVSPLSTYTSRKIKKDTDPHSGQERLLV